MGARYKRNGVESGTIILLNEEKKNAWVLVDYDLSASHNSAEAEAYAIEKGGPVFSALPRRARYIGHALSRRPCPEAPYPETAKPRWRRTW